MVPDGTPLPSLRFGAVSEDAVRSRWAAGEPALMAWLLLDTAAAATTVAAAGVDAVSIDVPHGAASIHRLADILTAVDATSATPFVRVSWNDPAEIMRVLDLGARGAICPMISTRQQAEAFVAACRYPPDGIRSYGPVRAAFGAGRIHTSTADEAVMPFAMIETAEGLANVDEIAAAPGLTGLFVGPTDLSLDLHIEALADFENEQLLDALDRVLDACEHHDLVPGIHAPVPDDAAAAMIERGYRLVSFAVDTDVLGRGVASALRRLRPV
jgi:4-hydroxy-2-oxoheptanedioate aldolase